MIKHTRYREAKQTKKRIDPLFMAVIAMLVFVPVINACSTTPHSGATRKTQINTNNVEANSLKLPDGYEWDGEEDSDYDDEDTATSSFKKGTTMAFKADKNAPTSTRLSAIEDQLALLREDFNELYPSMRRLMAIEQDMQELIMELKSLTSDVAASAPAPQAGLSQTLTKEQAIARANELKARAQQGDNTYMAPTTAPAVDLTKPPIVAPPQATNAPVTQTLPPTAAPVSSGPVTATATGMRIGIHADIVRVVVDYTSGSTVNYNKSMGAQSFTLNLPSTSYEGRKTWHSEFVPMVSSYSVQQNGSDAAIQFALEPGVTLKSAFIIPPKSATEKPRLVIDFSE